MKTPRYVLAQHVFLCRSEGYIFFLDLKKDAYFALEAAKTAGLSEHVCGWPVHFSGGEAGEIEAKSSGAAVAEYLARSGLLCEDEAKGKAVVPLTLAIPTTELTATKDRPDQIRLSDAMIFFMTSVTGAIKYKCCSLEKLVSLVKRKRANLRNIQKTPDAERARQLVATFYKLRPLLFSSKDSCLFQSFILLEFLSYYGSFPNWVFGIQGKPFGAHCWVQQGNLLFTDSIEHISRLEPIMSV